MKRVTTKIAVLLFTASLLFSLLSIQPRTVNGANTPPSTGAAYDELADKIQQSIEIIRSMPDDGKIYTIDERGGIITLSTDRSAVDAVGMVSHQSVNAVSVPFGGDGDGGGSGTGDSADTPFYLHSSYTGLPKDPLPADYTTGTSSMDFLIQGDWKYRVSEEYIHDPENGDYRYETIYVYDPGNGDYTKEYHYDYVGEGNGDYLYQYWYEYDPDNGYYSKEPIYDWVGKGGTHRVENVYAYDPENGSYYRCPAYEYVYENGTHRVEDIYIWDPEWGYYSRRPYYEFDEENGTYAYDYETETYYYDPDNGMYTLVPDRWEYYYDYENGEYRYCHIELVPDPNGNVCIIPDRWEYWYDDVHGDYRLVKQEYVPDEISGQYIVRPDEWRYIYDPDNGEYVSKSEYIYTPGAGDYTINYDRAYYNYTPGSGDYRWGGSQYVYDPENGYLRKAQICEIIEYIGNASSVTIPATLGDHTVTRLGSWMFNYQTAVNITSITLPDTIDTIEYAAFGYTSITSLHIPASVENFPNNPFVGAGLLETVTFGEGSQFKFDNKVIYNVGKTEVVAFLETFSETTYTLPDTLMRWSYSTYSGNNVGISRVERFAVDNNPNFKVIDGVLFSADGKTLVVYPTGNTRETYTVPDFVETVGSASSYAYNQYLKTVIIPEGVITLNNPFGWSDLIYENVDGEYQPTSADAMIYHISSTVQHIFESGNCNMNGGFYVDANNPYFTSLDGVLYTKDMKTLLAYPDRKIDMHFTLPSTVEAIRHDPHSPFINALVREIKLPASLTSVKPNDFQWLDWLKAFVVDEDHPQLAAKDGVLYSKDGKFLISYPWRKTDTTYCVEAGTEWVDVRNCWQPMSSYLQEITFPNSVRVIGNDANSHYAERYSATLTIKGTNDYTRRWASYFGFNYIRIDATTEELETVIEEANDVLDALLDETAPLDRESMRIEQYYEVTGVIDLFDALSEAEKSTLPENTVQKIEEAREAIAQINHTDDNVSINGADWNIRVEASSIDESDVSYTAVESIAGEESEILALYDIKLTKNNGTYNLPAGQKITVTINGDFSGLTAEERAKVRIYHLKEDLTSAYIRPETITDTAISFEVDTFSFFGVAIRLTQASGDVNGDDGVDIGDVNLLYMHVRGKTILEDNALLAADVNDDGVVNIGDVNLLYMFVRGKIATME